MSSLWPKSSKERPCIICEGTDWCCRFGDRRMLCMRVSSNHPAQDGGFYHEYSRAKPVYVGPSRPAPRRINPKWVSQKFNCDEIDNLAIELGVSVESLKALDAAWSPQDKAWVFPMKNGGGEVVGFRTRTPSGEKKAITGSQGGLFIPNADIEIQDVAYLPEGPTDTAAMLTMGFYTIGRPSCNSGTEQLRILLKRLKIYRVVIVSDNDEEKTRPNGAKWRPGLEGAKKLKKDLGLMSVLWMPPNPLKDPRELLRRIGIDGARNIINDSVKSKVWTRI